MRTTHWTTLAGLALLSIQAACTIEGSAKETDRGEPQEQAPASAAAPALVTITARDFAFDAPETLPAGLTTIRLVNQGPDMHHVQLMRLEEGRTIQDFIDHVAAGGGEVAPFAHLVGGPNVPVPGGHSEATLKLEPGTYALVCVIPGADGVMHVMKGMIKPLIVLPAQTPAATAPAADVRMVLRDYSFEITPEITAGRHSILVENAAAQPHEVVVMKLAPGKTAQDLLGWIMKQEGPPPAMPVGGTTMLSQGETNQVTADFTPGEYALLCFAPDAGDRQPHVAHGMVRQITVR
ncbi:MAG TPA: hypothetical protein VHG08_26380 [Longimicrobium sp.]|nr:hypothetical protein [Longimicrobium sp.]